jgi:hypothetical protein
MTHRGGLSFGELEEGGGKFPFALGPKNYLGNPDKGYYCDRQKSLHLNFTFILKSKTEGATITIMMNSVFQ